VKRISLIALVVIYLLSCAGVDAERFYCCGKLASVTFSYGAGKHADGQATANKKCCKTEKVSFKIKDNHVSSAKLALGKVFPANIATITWLPFHVPAIITRNDANQSNAPPGPDISLCILNCNYRI
jgi:hypothetical protein